MSLETTTQDPTCDHPKTTQGEGSQVCTDPTCPASARADLITSCCLVEPGQDGTCAECGTPINDADPLPAADCAEVVKGMRDFAKSLRELGRAMRGPQLVSSGETDAHFAERQAKAAARLDRADRLDALAAKLEG